MGEQEPCMIVRARDVSVDDEGKVTIDNPQTAEMMTAMLRYTPNPGHTGGGGGVTNINCPNLVPACGAAK
ncbi:hypothetical protein [Nonomuraea glycinis]|uniref:hypothetical protein n=1 Tax=Nonomuraea glycinis TaxID=2047744 RepID=UPI0033A35AB8